MHYVFHFGFYLKTNTKSHFKESNENEKVESTFKFDIFFLPQTANELNELSDDRECMYNLIYYFPQHFLSKMCACL